MMALTSSPTACSTSLVGCCITTVGELSSRDANCSGETAVSIAWVTTIEMVGVMASTSATARLGDLTKLFPLS